MADVRLMQPSHARRARVPSAPAARLPPQQPSRRRAAAARRASSGRAFQELAAIGAVAKVRRPETRCRARRWSAVARRLRRQLGDIAGRWSSGLVSAVTVDETTRRARAQRSAPRDGADDREDEAPGTRRQRRYRPSRSQRTWIPALVFEKRGRGRIARGRRAAD